MVLIFGFIRCDLQPALGWFAAGPPSLRPLHLPENSELTSGLQWYRFFFFFHQNSKERAHFNGEASDLSIDLHSYPPLRSRGRVEIRPKDWKCRSRANRQNFLCNLSDLTLKDGEQHVHPERAWKRTAACLLLHRKESVKVFRPSDQDASWSHSCRGASPTGRRS